METVLMSAVKMLLVKLLSAMSDQLRNVAVEGAYKFMAYAETTETDYDNILAQLLLDVLGLENKD